MDSLFISELEIPLKTPKIFHERNWSGMSGSSFYKAENSVQNQGLAPTLGTVVHHPAHLSQRWVHIKEEGAVDVVTSHFSKVSLIPTKGKTKRE